MYFRAVLNHLLTAQAEFSDHMEVSRYRCFVTCPEIREAFSIEGGTVDSVLSASPGAELSAVGLCSPGHL